MRLLSLVKQGLRLYRQEGTADGFANKSKDVPTEHVDMPGVHNLLKSKTSFPLNCGVLRNLMSCLGSAVENYSASSWYNGPRSLYTNVACLCYAVIFFVGSQCLYNPQQGSVPSQVPLVDCFAGLQLH